MYQQRTGICFTGRALKRIRGLPIFLKHNTVGGGGIPIAGGLADQSSEAVIMRIQGTSCHCHTLFPGTSKHNIRSGPGIPQKPPIPRIHVHASKNDVLDCYGIFLILVMLEPGNQPTCMGIAFV